MLEQVRYQAMLTQSGIFVARYRSKIRDARMLMQALVSSMPMPSYVGLCIEASLEYDILSALTYEQTK